jgi:hypothetical protein
MAKGFGERRKITINQEVLGRTDHLLSFGTARTIYKTTTPTILLCSGNVFTLPLPSNDKGIHLQTYRLMEGIYEIGH